MTTSGEAATPGRADVLLGLLACAVVVRLWAMPLSSSLWLDECGTAWVTAGGWREILDRARLFPQSVPYAAVVWGMRSLFGASEIALRVPSLAAMIAAAYCLARLGRELFDRETGLIAAGVFLVFPQIEFAACDARPYALAVLAATCALWMLVRWLDRGRLGNGLAYVAFAAATVWLHYLFATALVAHAAYALWRRRRGCPASGRQMLLVATSLALTLVPAAMLVAEIGGQRSSHAFVGAPGPGDLARAVVPIRVLGVLVPSLLACWLLRLATGASVATLRGRRDGLFLLLVAALAPAPLLFAVSRADGTNLFLTRYLMGTVPAQALLLGALVRTVEPERGRRAVLACTLALVLVLRGELGHVEISHGRENWRGAVAALNGVNGDGPVLLGGSFLEARDLALVRDPAHVSYLRAPLDVYPTLGPAFVVPLGREPEKESYVAGLLAEAPTRDRLALIERRSAFPSWEPWLQKRLGASGYWMKDVFQSETLKVRVFERARAGRAGPHRAAR